MTQISRIDPNSSAWTADPGWTGTMDESVCLAMARWPNVPDLYGWLELDLRGRWQIRGEPILHDGLNRFIGRNYLHDDRGRWYFQNGPQRVFVRLAYTPWILHLDAAGGLHTQTGLPIASLSQAILDDEDNLLLVTEAGPGLVDAEALVTVCDWFRSPGDVLLGAAALESACNDLQAGQSTDCTLAYGDRSVPLHMVARSSIPATLQFDPDPQEPATQ